LPPSRTGSRRRGKKNLDRIKTTYLDLALVDFSGYLAIDELYDGPCCVLSIVDNRRYNRLAFRVLDHKPTHKDIRAFLSEFKAQLDEGGLVVRGITTDGSPLYPKVLKELWPDVPHQSCRFHILMEITKAEGAGQTPQTDESGDSQAERRFPSRNAVAPASRTRRRRGGSNG
jgi:hypothetical protein